MCGKNYLNIIAFLKSHLVNSVDPDLKKLADQDLHCFFKKYTLNITYKCSHINGLISSLILVRSFSNFQQI